ncbi:MAG: DNA repair protein RadA [Peptococcaceae bacterium]|nr:MAG: DNA repair protein RadA [Peptococcaceae bacterium]
MRVKSIYYCRTCGQHSARWLGRCPGCGEWNTLVEEPAWQAAKTGAALTGAQPPCPVTLVSAGAEERFTTDMAEVDRVLGGGVVPGSLILVGGDPGIGKSTLLLQVAYLVSRKLKVLYVSGEESTRQVRLRAERLGALAPGLFLAAETDLSLIEQYLQDLTPQLAVIDSIQTVSCSEITSAPGSVGQVRECTARLMRLAKSTGVSLFLVGHVTKEGMLAGPRVLEHIVDTVLYFEGDRHQSYRILRGVKNRFGSTNEIGVFDMQKQGLVEIANPSALFLLQHPDGIMPGSVVVAGLEGTRPLLVEVQALVCPTGFGVPRRMTAGVDYNRAVLITAVLEKRLGLSLSNCDVFVNAVGGVKLDEPAVDLGIALALASSFRDISVRPGLVAAGEVGLTGEVRPVGGIEKRLHEASKLGFTSCLVPRQNLPLALNEEMAVTGVETLAQALESALQR